MKSMRRSLWVAGVMAAVGGAAFLYPAARQPAQAQVSQTPVLSNFDQKTLLDRAELYAGGLNSAFRGFGGNHRRAKVVIALVARDGRLLNTRVMPDAWTAAYDLAVGKARTAAFFSSNENAVTSRAIGNLSQAHDPKTGEGPAGPFWGIWSSNEPGGVFNAQVRNGIVTQPGGVPLYKQGVLVGGLGVAGDSVDKDEEIAFQAELSFPPPANINGLGF